jgi:hypothetical protein
MPNCEICSRNETGLWIAGEVFHKVKLENIETKQTLVGLVCTTCLNKMENRK